MLPTNPLLNATAPAGPHLPTATLRQYAAGTLAPAARHRVEAHTLACPRCADILDGLLQTTPATTDQALHQLQQRLRLRVQQAETARPALRRAGHRWLVPQLAAAATLLFGLLAGGWYTWQQRHHPPAEVAASRPAPAASQTPAPAEAPAASAPIVAPAAEVPAGRKPLVATAPPTNRYSIVVAAARQQPALAGRPAAASPPPPPDTLAQPLARANEAKPLAAPAASAPARATPAPDSVALASGFLDTKRKAAVASEGRSRASLMPSAPAVPPTPAIGYPAWREKIRREATEFKPDDGQRTLSGTVQLRLLIGADGKIQELRVLHGLRDDYDEEAQRLVCDNPGWLPGIGGGKRAAQAVDVSVPF